jgi:hypothetical protein
MRPQHCSDLAQEPVAFRVAVLVVHVLEAVDVEESERQPAARAVRPLDLHGNPRETELARQDARQLVGAGERQVAPRFVAGLDRGGSVVGRLFSVGRRPHPVVGGARTVCGRLRPDAICAFDQFLGADLAAAVQVVEQGSPVVLFGGPVAQLGRAVALVPRHGARGRRLVAKLRHGLPVVRRPCPDRRRPLMGRRIVSGADVVVGGPLIIIGARLVAVGPGLVRVTCGLVAVGSGLFVG